MTIGTLTESDRASVLEAYRKRLRLVCTPISLRDNRSVLLGVTSTFLGVRNTQNVLRADLALPRTLLEQPSVLPHRIRTRKI